MYFVLTARILFIATSLLLNFHAFAFSQTPASDQKPGASSISGRVTIGANPAVEKRVVVREVKNYYGNSGIYLQGDESREGKVFIGLTDADGKYRVSGLPAGNYMVSVAILRAYTLAAKSGQKERQIQLDDEEERADIDFALVRGGVITGRVTDPEGRPIIGGFISVNHADRPDGGIYQAGNGETDDRGVYRIYGLPAGRYRVTAGARGRSLPKYAITYHPSVTDEKQATVIELSEASEVGDVDVRLNNKKNDGRVISGRVIDSETGEPVSQGTIFCYGVGQNRGQFHQIDVDTLGNFQLIGLTPGKYALQVGPGYPSSGQQKFYSDRTTIEVAEADISGLEIRVKRGGAISGVAVFEDDNPAPNVRLSQTIITGNISLNGDDGSRISSSSESVKVKSDGSFRIDGLQPGVVSLKTGNLVGTRPPLILRVERNGAAIPNSIEVSSGETIAGIRLVLTDKTGTIRGQIIFSGGGMPAGMKIIAFAYRNEDTSSFNYTSPSVVVDKKGRFVIEGLIDGEYQVILNKGPEDGSSASWAGSQNVQVTRGAEAQVTLTLDQEGGRGKNER